MGSSFLHFVTKRGAVALVAIVLTASSRAAYADDAGPSEASLAAPVERATLIRAAIARDPSFRASAQRVRSIESSADAEGRLPAPMAMGQVWQVPFNRPYALGATMIMVGVRQRFPAAGSLGARAESKRQDARVEEAMGGDRHREVARRVAHAFADYVEAADRHRIHTVHLDVARRVLDLGEARHDAGGALTDVTQAEVELARTEADVVADATLVRSARTRINALLARDPGAPLGQPVVADPALPVWDTATLIAKAREARPELRAAAAEREARRASATAAERESTWPDFTLGAYYFPPTEALPLHGYGFDATLSLPWLWSGESKKSLAEHQAFDAAVTNVEAARIPVDVEVIASEAEAKSAAARLQVLRDRALPASKRSFDAAWAGYESGRTDALTLLSSRRAVVDVEHDIVRARAALDHAMADLDAAVGLTVPTAPIGTFDESSLEVNHGH